MTHSTSPHLTTWISYHIELAPVRNVRLLRAYTNHVHLVETHETPRYVLKVYGTGWREDSGIRYEVDLLDHLASRGILVAQAIQGRNGEALQHTSGGDGKRQAVIFDFAAGTKPESPFAPALYHREGRAVAALHRASDDFRTPHQRRPLNLEALIDEPLALVASLDIDASVARFIVDFGRVVRARIEALADAGLD